VRHSDSIKGINVLLERLMFSYRVAEMDSKPSPLPFCDSSRAVHLQPSSRGGRVREVSGAQFGGVFDRALEPPRSEHILILCYLHPDHFAPFCS
jgi:hypothetical protein